MMATGMMIRPAKTRMTTAAMKAVTKIARARRGSLLIRIRKCLWFSEAENWLRRPQPKRVWPLPNHHRCCSQIQRRPDRSASLAWNPEPVAKSVRCGSIGTRRAVRAIPAWALIAGISLCRTKSRCTTPQSTSPYLTPQREPAASRLKRNLAGLFGLQPCRCRLSNLISGICS
jgi:hypothetical protein